MSFRWKTSAATLTIVLTVIVASCDDTTPKSPAPASGTTGLSDVNPERMRQLSERAKAGDWRAPEALGADRYLRLQKYDRETLDLLRQACSHNPQGLGLLAELLYRSCKEEDRREAIETLKRYIASEPFKSMDIYSQHLPAKF